MPLLDLPEVSASRSLSGLRVPSAEADWMSWRACAGLVEAGSRKIQGTLVEVSLRSTPSSVLRRSPSFAVRVMIFTLLEWDGLAIRPTN